MSLFKNRFKLLLEQPGELDELPPMDPESVESEDDTLSAVDDVPTNPGLNYKREMTSIQTNELRAWIEEIDGFKRYLNGTDGESLQAKINGAECDTLFNEISRSETKKIARIAQDLSALVESLKGYLLSHEDE